MAKVYQELTRIKDSKPFDRTVVEYQVFNLQYENLYRADKAGFENLRWKEDRNSLPKISLNTGQSYLYKCLLYGKNKEEEM